MISRFFALIRGIFDIFLLEKKKSFPIFQELFLDKTEHYRQELGESYLDGVFVSCQYSQEAKDIIERFKYKHEKKISLFLTPFYIHLFEKFIKKQDKIIITGIPMFFLHTLKRGYNQSYLLARHTAKESNLPFREILRKIRWTKHQAQLKRTERLINLENAFKMRENYNKSIQ